MARLVLATFGSLGDLHPVLALAFELRSRGHTVTVATSECYRGKIGALGLAFAPLRPDVSVSDEDLIRRIMHRARGPEVLLREIMLPAVRDMLADLAAACTGADLLVANELVYAAPLLAEQSGLRWVSFALAPMSYFSAHDPCAVPGAIESAWVTHLPVFAARLGVRAAQLFTYSWWSPVRRLRRALGLRPDGNPLFAGKHSPLLDLALFSPVLQSPQPDWPAFTRQCGFCFYDETTPHCLLPAIEDFLAAGAPPIVFTLGSAAVYSAHDFFVESARAAQLLNRRALLVLGKNSPPPDLPPTILACDYLPYAAIFPRAAAVVHQGGVGTTAQALRAGRPMLVVPFAFDQPDNAARITRLGVGQTLRRSRFTAARAARSLEVVLAPSVAARAREVAAAVARDRGVSHAVDLIVSKLS